MTTFTATTNNDDDDEEMDTVDTRTVINSIQKQERHSSKKGRKNKNMITNVATITVPATPFSTYSTIWKQHRRLQEEKQHVCDCKVTHNGHLKHRKGSNHLGGWHNTCAFAIQNAKENLNIANTVKTWYPLSLTLMYYIIPKPDDVFSHEIISLPHTHTFILCAWPYVPTDGTRIILPRKYNLFKYIITSMVDGRWQFSIARSMPNVHLNLKFIYLCIKFCLCFLPMQLTTVYGK